MSLAADEPLLETPDAGTRHLRLEAICQNLQAVMVGRTAQGLLEAGLPESAVRLVVLPAWDWRLPAMEIGRKGREHRTGKALLMPVRLDWGGNQALVRLEAIDAPTELYAWAATSMGYHDRGTMALTGTARHAHGVTNVHGGAVSIQPSMVKLTGTRGGTERILRDLARAGQEAMWQLLLSLEPFVTATVRKAHSAVCHEIGALTGFVQDVLHETGIEQVVNGMMFGASDEAGSGSVQRMIELCLRPDCFARVDPMMFMHSHIRRDAEQEVRKLIGDPRIGGKIRRVAAEMPRATVEEIVAEYRNQYPNDRLSVARAEAALSVRPDPMARTVLLDPQTNRRAG